MTGELIEAGHVVAVAWLLVALATVGAVQLVFDMFSVRRRGSGGATEGPSAVTAPPRVGPGAAGRAASPSRPPGRRRRPAAL